MYLYLYLSLYILHYILYIYIYVNHISFFRVDYFKFFTKYKQSKVGAGSFGRKLA